VKYDKMGTFKCQGGLGFCELESLKKALLEKQCKTLLQNLDSSLGGLNYQGKILPLWVYL